MAFIDFFMIVSEHAGLVLSNAEQVNLIIFYCFIENTITESSGGPSVFCLHDSHIKCVMYVCVCACIK